ncbi:MAG: exo-alpha-sialidase [Bacteroidetes bacterium 24-39-8]|jgi:sialidase-1|nr:MAG: exo-alpha-sialidase [Sphingobacteriia bacterium 35-40-8]OYZ49889.1 MAG: exo-alpha-sialidase [Bacteroidetes bacterium 24-39-8]OZA63769.1 MAG: exo-alpha-sialidase [Sphingobacteriia bacterium 39-39-8]HQR92839.1 sialidase family protein [Sediminibacterium sp.]HQS55626.1 sialidase family protein [Sediminibacterium sp.]
MKYFSLFIFCCWQLIIGFAQDAGVPVFESGKEGYKSFRIPAIIALNNRELLAFCEGRVNGASDFGNIDLVLKRSKDKGKSWSALKIVVDNDNMQISNPAPVLDLLDPEYPKGRILLFYNTGDNHESEVLKGNGSKYCWYISSVDGGHTWSEPIDITLQAHRPNRPSIDPAFNFKEGWRYHANTPGHVTQFNDGKYKGRIFIAANHSAGPIQKNAGQYEAHGYYSDDHGKTFQISKSIGLPGSNESTAAVLSNDRLIMNSRNQAGTIKARIVAYSSDGGSSWDTAFYDKQLPDPVCEGSIVELGKQRGKQVLAFCNAADTLQRNHLTLRISFDEGKTWPQIFPIYQGEAPSKKGFDFAAYSDIVKIDKHSIGVLYEKDNYASVNFVIKEWK